MFDSPIFVPPGGPYSPIQPQSVVPCTGVFQPAKSCPDGTVCPTPCETKAIEWKAKEAKVENPACTTECLAIVKGSPILASELLERYGKQLSKAKTQLPPERYEEACAKLIQRDLGRHIEQKFLLRVFACRSIKNRGKSSTA